MPTSKMFFHTSCLFLDDLQYIEIIRYDFSFQEHHFSYIFFFHANYFFRFSNFQSDFNDYFNFEANWPGEQFSCSWPRKFFFCGIFFSNHHLKFSTCFLEFFLHFFSALFETDIYTRAMIFNSYYGRCFLKGFFFANFLFHRRIWILKSAEDDVFFWRGKSRKKAEWF